MIDGYNNETDIRGKRMMLLLFYIYLNRGKEVNVSDLMRIVGYRSSGAIHNALNNLEFYGCIERKGDSFIITEKGMEELRSILVPYELIKLLGKGLIVLGGYSLAVWYLFSNRILILLDVFRNLSIGLVAMGVFLLLIDRWVFRKRSKSGQR